jgi:VCBS repeat protein/FG-GAP repeat protein
VISRRLLLSVSLCAGLARGCTSSALPAATITPLNRKACAASRAPKRPRLTAVIAAIALVQAGCGQTTPSTSPGASPAASASVAVASAAPTATPAPPSDRPTPGPYAGLWTDATSQTIGQTADYTNKVEVADINGDGFPDLLLANGGYEYEPGDPEASRVYLNGGPGQRFADATQEVFGDLKGLTRVIKVRDLNADSYPDIVLGTTFETQSQLFFGSASGAFTKATDRLPQGPLSIGDLEIGDVDTDGDPDIVLADWGTGEVMENQGARVRLWLNDGKARFTEAPSATPATPVRFSWDLELVDVDNDWDLDLAVSSNLSESSFLFTNDGYGRFTDVTADRMPHYTNNYEFEPMDLDGDGFLDLVTINDGPNAREHVFSNDGKGGYVDATDEWWPDAANPSEDDGVVTFVDVDSDGDADFVIGALGGGPDRLLINDGFGHLSLVRNAFDATPSGGTLGMLVTDLNDDGRPDVVEAQGETQGSFDERVYLATDRMAPDSAAPHVRTDLAVGATGTVAVHARVTDGASPSLAGRDGLVEVRWDGSTAPAPLYWYGEFLFRADVAVPAGATGLRVCALDRAGNEACVPAM